MGKIIENKPADLDKPVPLDDRVGKLFEPIALSAAWGNYYMIVTGRTDNMTLEQHVEKVLTVGGSLNHWRGAPYSYQFRLNALETSDDGKEEIFFKLCAQWIEVEEIIVQYSLVECLTSKYEYVREYRLWYEQVISGSR